MLQQSPHVALIIETSKAFGRGLLRGISDYMTANQRWSIYVDERGLSDPPPHWLSDWKGHGAIVRAQTRKITEVASRLNLPVVDTLNQMRERKFPAVIVADVSIARMAAEHLLEKQCTKRAGEGGQEDLSKWLCELPKPIGVMAAHDLRALCVLDACRRAGVFAPDEVAVIGVDNDEILCELANPPLTSVQLDLALMGYEAAALLAHLMKGVNALQSNRSSFAPWESPCGSRLKCWQSTNQLYPGPALHSRKREQWHHSSPGS